MEPKLFHLPYSFKRHLRGSRSLGSPVSVLGSMGWSIPDGDRPLPFPAPPLPFPPLPPPLPPLPPPFPLPPFAQGAIALSVTQKHVLGRIQTPPSPHDLVQIAVLFDYYHIIQSAVNDNLNKITYVEGKDPLLVPTVTSSSLDNNSSCPLDRIRFV